MSSDKWVYQSIVESIPGIDITVNQSLIVQFIIFEVVVLSGGILLDYHSAIFPGTVATSLSVIGSKFLHSISDELSIIDNNNYSTIMFDSNIEVMFAVFAFCFVTAYLFVQNTALINNWFGNSYSVLPVTFMLLLAWDVCYRIGVSWWIAFMSVWRDRYDNVSELGNMKKIDKQTLLFSLSQLLLIPVFFPHSVVLTILVIGHIGAVIVCLTYANIRENT